MAKNKVKKSTDLKSLDELNLSEYTLSYIRRNQIPLKDLVELGRTTALHALANPSGTSSKLKWKSELTSALDRAGYIRHDLFPETYRILKFYCAVFKADFPLLDTPVYENIPAVTTEEYQGVIRALACFSKSDRSILIYRYGLIGGAAHTLIETGRHFGYSRERIRQLEIWMLRQLAYPSRRRQLPPLYGFNTNPSAVTLKTDELSDLLHLSVRSCTSLHRAGIHSMEDIINYPPEKWRKIRNFGVGCAQEVEERMRNIGFRNFKIDI